ncbi:hypothetical protein FD04_GL001348 [Secundilactobacillus odoratitofui DSM 19909 = JCM 15043]|uniref:Uncharacterized protein n=1 Tax=Secundilactobacillus odoratitofui DSM 19909 = JCM 15043 TaxID=1423776 RepID=A0A0R1LVW8_9LACO|nr:hypothetical protein FD04_GL001348 [Secundilactobacillus odoratitofui DSM 19909 = JCM 15043]
METVNDSRHKDHLRMCGEYSHKPTETGSILGSPPHVRRIPTMDQPTTKTVGITSACAENTLNRFVIGDGELGITSACAENTARPDSDDEFLRDHLRMCGEYSL